MAKINVIETRYAHFKESSCHSHQPAYPGSILVGLYVDTMATYTFLFLQTYC